MADYDELRDPRRDHEPQDHDWQDHLEHAEQEHQDRLIRHGSLDPCCICHERVAWWCYGNKCRECFEQQREEREAA